MTQTLIQQRQTVHFTQIIVEDRLRVDMGEVEELAESIKTVGLLHPVVVEMLPGETPQDILSPKYRLMCGGRRFAAMRTLSESDPVFEMVPVTIFNTLPPHERVKIELEENLKRKAMTWQEKCIGVYKYHRACMNASILDKTFWSQDVTGEMLNMSQASVSINILVAKALIANNEKVSMAETFSDAVKVLVGNKIDETQAEIMRRIAARRVAAQAAAPTLEAPRVPSITSSVSVPISAASVMGQPATAKPQPTFSKDDIANFYHHGNALEVLPLLAKSNPINHIICDPPYGIDMDNLVSDSVDRIADTHTVAGNLELLPKFLQVAYDCIAKDGFLCMWYDLDHHEKIAQWARHTGWKVQRWPVIWTKSSMCRNSQAQYNVTKATEVCYMLRRSETSIIKQKQSRNFIEAASCATPSHPFPKPKAVWDYLIDTVSVEGNTIVDPFAGEGSSLAAIFQKKRVPVGIEIDEKHINSGLGYIEEQINSKSLLDGLLEEPPL